MNDEKQQAQFRAQEERSTSERAQILGMSYLDTRGMAENAELVADALTIDQMYQQKVVPLRAGTDEHSAVFGVTSSTPQSFLKAIENDFSGKSSVVEFVMISMSGFREYMLRYDPPKVIQYNDVTIAKQGDSETIEEVSRTLEGVLSDDLLDYLIEQADRLSASDIHLETQKNGVRIRFRVDGALHAIAVLSHDKYRILQASIASRANISTAERQPQSGHIQYNFVDQPGRSLNMRIETVPTSYGQDAVIRLFNFDESLLNIERLGLDEGRRRLLDQIVAHPHGMVMVVGPTGSGKSTTLYSLLNALNQTDRKLVTLEDPIEMALTGITQIPVETTAGDSFADRLRAVLRIDPDVIMVGEIRDVDTAKTAIQASITGHLVLSTFHASSASAAFSRMIDMIGQNPIFANAIRMVISQRLVRRLDDATKIAYDPDETERQWIREALGEMPAGFEVPDISTVKLYKPGSSAEVPFGYSGRVVVMEQLIVNEEIQRFIRGEIKDVNVAEIERTARSQGMLTMMQDALMKVLRGETTLEEVNRVL